MIRQELYVEPYDWTVYAFLGAKPKDAGIILSALDHIGINAAQYMRAERHLQRTFKDGGMNYSSQGNRKSVMVVGVSSSDQETLNTFSHELRHLVDDIATANNIPTIGEEVAYLTGNIALGLSACLLRIVCECPVCSKG